MYIRRSIILAAVTACAITALVSGTRADEFPQGTMRFVVPFPAGASTDVVMRAVANKLKVSLGNTFIVENKPGAGGMIATEHVVKSKPDGTTLLATPNSLASNPALFKSLPFDTMKDLQPVSLVFRTPLVLLVNTDLPVKSLSELIALLKKKPGQLKFAHGGAGSAINLAGVLLQNMTNTKMSGIPYRGTPLALNDLIGGSVELMFADIGGAVGQIQSGKVRAIAVTSTERVPALADVPTMIEAGLPGFEVVGWTMICAPTGTPRATVDKLAIAIGQAVEQQDVKDLLVRIGTLPVKSLSPDKLKPFLASEIARWGKLIEDAGVAKSL